MRFSINRTELQNALSIVLKGVSTRSTLPVLSGILLDAHQDALTLQSTDLELSIQYSTAALIEEEGKTVIPGKLCSDIVKSLPDAAVQIEVESDQAIIQCEASSFTIRTLNPDDFPQFPTVDPTQQIEVPFNMFSSMVKRVSRVVSRDESRAILTGVLISQEEDTLRLVATDSYRLAITETPFEGAGNDPFQVVIAGKFLSDVAALPKSDLPITLGVSENQIILTYGDTLFINRRIEGNFPNYRQLLPDSYTTRAKLNTNQLSSAIKRVSLLGSSSAPVKLDLNNASQTLQISAMSQDIGSAEETIPGQIEGDDMEIAFNYSYILEGLSVVHTDSVFLEAQSPMKPGIFRSDTEEDYLYLVMPIRIS